jgi:hypothetical protein
MVVKLSYPKTSTLIILSELKLFYGWLQLAQKWLKGRKESTLEFDYILHNQKIIVALTETDRLMNEINKIVIE